MADKLHLVYKHVNKCITIRNISQVLQQRRQGVGILVSKIPKETNASYSLQEPAEVTIFFISLNFVIYN